MALGRRLWSGVRALLRHEDARLLLGGLVPVLGFWLFAEIADEVREGELDAIDRALLLATRAEGDPTEPLGPPWFEDAMRDITALGGLPVLTLATAATAGYLLLKRSARALGLLLASTTGGLLLSLVLKAVHDRPRPDYVTHLAPTLTASFPSGHSSMSAVVYLTLAALLTRLVAENRLKVYCVAVALVLTMLVGLSRVYAGVHYPSDVIAGWALGLGWATFVWVVALALERRGRV